MNDEIFTLETPDNYSPFAIHSSQFEERVRRWRLVLGEASEEEQEEGGEDGTGDGESGDALSEKDQVMDQALEALYGDSKGGDLSDSAPDIARWLGDIRTYFSAPVVQVMQRDALKKLNLRKLLADPDFLEQIEPDINLLTQLLALRNVMPAKTRESARQVVRTIVEELREKLSYPLEQAIGGTLNRAIRARRPKYKEINWARTIYANLKHYQAEQGTIVPEKLVGYGRQRSSLRDVILCIDTSGSMATSVVYASVYGAVMASLPALSTKLVMFDTSVVDMTEQLADPVEMLFGIRLGGGTNIDRALGYCQGLVTRPRESILILISDLFEGGNKGGAFKRVATLKADGVQVIVLLALNDQGAPRFDRKLAQELVNLGVPSFACTPELFPDLMAAAIDGRDIRQWATAHDIVTAPDN